MDANNTSLYTTIKVENNTHTFAYQVQTVVYLTDGQGNNVASKTEKVAAVMLPEAKKKLIVHLAIPSNEQSSLRINAHTSSWALVQTGCQRGTQHRQYRTKPLKYPSWIFEGLLRKTHISSSRRMRY